MSPAAVVSIDLCGYAQTQAEQGTDEAELRLARLRVIAREAATAGDGVIADQCADNVCLIFPSVRLALRSTYWLLTCLEGRAKAGVAWGPMELRGTQWYGVPLAEASEPAERDARCGEVRLTAAAAERLEWEHGQ